MCSPIKILASIPRLKNLKGIHGCVSGLIRIISPCWYNKDQRKEFSNIMSRSHTILSLSCYSDLIFLTIFMLNRPHILKYFDDLKTVMLSMHLFYNMPNCRFSCLPISNLFTFSFPFIRFPPSLLFGYSQTIFWVIEKKDTSVRFLNICLILKYKWVNAFVYYLHFAILVLEGRARQLEEIKRLLGSKTKVCITVALSLRAKKISKHSTN